MTLRQLGQYEILERLGKGGRRFVYRAMDHRRGQVVALKVLPAWMEKNRAAAARFAREIEVEQVIEHANLVTLHTVGRTQINDPELVGSASDQTGKAEVSYLVMEYVEGEDLQDRLARGALPLGEALTTATQIARGLQAIHIVGVVHRNLNPGNVRLTPHGQVKLLDFRLAKLIKTEASRNRKADRFRTETGEVLGTVPYLAPEQFGGELADRRSDLFALGVILYQMVAGRLPFPQTDLLHYFHALEKEEPQPLSQLAPGVSVALEEVVLKLLAKDPEGRYQSATQVLSALAPLSP